MTHEITYAVGDVHGRADLLDAAVGFALDDAAARNAVPRFAFLGDICDRGPDSRRAFDTVAEILSLYDGSFLVRGNHDDWFARCLSGCESRVVAGWLGRGGVATLESYLHGDLNGAVEVIKTLHSDHIRLVDSSARLIRDGNLVYTHAGVDPSRPLGMQDPHDLMWVREAFLDHVGDLGVTVFHGHSVVGDCPVVTENRVSLDTGAYRSGRLTVAAVDTKSGTASFFQTDGTAARVVPVDPVLLDRGLGTAVDSQGRLSVRVEALAA